MSSLVLFKYNYFFGLELIIMTLVSLWCKPLCILNISLNKTQRYKWFSYQAHHLMGSRIHCSLVSYATQIQHICLWLNITSLKLNNTHRAALHVFYCLIIWFKFLLTSFRAYGGGNMNHRGVIYGVMNILLNKHRLSWSGTYKSYRATMYNSNVRQGCNCITMQLLRLL